MMMLIKRSANDSFDKQSFKPQTFVTVNSNTNIDGLQVNGQGSNNTKHVKISMKNFKAKNSLLNIRDNAVINGS